MVFIPFYCYTNCRIIIHVVARMKYEPLSLEPLLFLLFPLNEFVPAFLDGASPEPFVKTEVLALIVFLCGFGFFTHFVLGVLREITSYLDINCLTIKYKKL